AALVLPLLLEAQSTATPMAVASSRQDSAAVADALQRFLSAFENLDWVPFRATFSDSATVFQPAPEMPARVAGPRGIDSTFRAVFANIRAHATSGPPYQRLAPTNLRIQPLASGVVLVTFELRNAERLARRTMVFRHEDAGWRIVHLHASNLAARPTRAPTSDPPVGVRDPEA
ncbi:MAG TPA: nuclear transport factor 2 family protein, partial [Gemmatimonadaceae bacterium]|nr:nuclear transport factor 2 family protein [Gemmatimonadaceae bacterium]